MAEEGYLRVLERFRAERLERLKAAEGWLRLAGRFWLATGENRIGSDPAFEIVLPARAPRRVGTLRVTGEKLLLAIEPGVDATFRGEPVGEMVLLSDGEGKRAPDKIHVGDFTFWVIERSGRLALRLFDQQADTLKGFRGLDHFPTDPRYRVTARFVPYGQPRVIPFTTVIQTTVDASIPGEVHFELDGQALSLLPIAEPGEEEFFFVFADKTSGNETYGGGRFLYAGPPGPDGRFELDFNKATNPPCAFTRFATCPIPRRENRLAVEVRAGEKRYAKDDDHLLEEAP